MSEWTEWLDLLEEHGEYNSYWDQFVGDDYYYEPRYNYVELSKDEEKSLNEYIKYYFDLKKHDLLF